ncbi:unnamed protein product [Adineta ricciae]|uniref:Kinesin light chain n=1 Tax=Adineta ricciae TaxID=249248 RepID=A0A815K2H4_ADIRI|nr:unnamed protein product [Adineta ricciae]
MARVIDSRETRSHRIVQDFLLIWLDNHMNEFESDVQNSLGQLRSIVNSVFTFTDLNQCIQFLETIKDEKIFLIISGDIDDEILSLVHNINQLDSIYIFQSNQQRIADWLKIKGIFTEITSLCDALKQAVHQCDKDVIAMSFVPTSHSSNSISQDRVLDPMFMYSQLLKEALLEIDFDQQSTRDLAEFCRELFRENPKELKRINEFERDYHLHTSIWWYTYDFCLHRMLNHALRVFDMDIILKMGFFLADLHRQILQLHRKQSSRYSSVFTVYRGQGLSQDEFNKLNQVKGGFLSFNNFLSTSKDRSVSLKFARQALQKVNSVGLLFHMTIDPTNSSTPFALLDNVSYYKDVEQEILFSMHTVFRIGDVQPIENGNQRLWQVNLALTNDQDPKLLALTKSMRDATSGAVGWYRLGQLLFAVNALDKAENLYQTLIEQTGIDNHQRGHIYHMIGMIRNNQGDYAKAVSFFEKSLQIQERIYPRNDLNLASTYNNIGSVYDQLHEYPKALAFQEKALAIRERLLPANHPDLATSFDNIGRVYSKMGEYAKALTFYEKDLDISQQSLPSNHPDLATSYNNVALVHNRMGDHTKALSFYEKALEISQQSLPPNHPDLASTYNNIAAVYYQIEEYAKARAFYERALDISRRSLSSNHPNLAISYDNIGLVYFQLGDCLKSLSSYEKALEIKQKARPTHQPGVATSNYLIGNVYDKMGNYTKAVVFYERALSIVQSSSLSNEMTIQLYRYNLERVKNKL